MLPTSDSVLRVEGLEHLPAREFANAINSAFLETTKAFTPLQAIPPFDANLDVLILSENDVSVALSKLNPRKASGPEGVPNWVLREYGDILSRPITSLLNSSFAEQQLPSSWKLADIVPLTKQKPAKDINKPLRPISLTPTTSKVAEDFVVTAHVAPAVLKTIHPDQFGRIPKSSMVQALTSMLHHWMQASDGTGSAIRVVLFDYHKAFDFIDHHLLSCKIMSLDISRGVARWVIDSLAHRYGGPQVHTEFEKLTTISKSPHRIRKAHTEFEKPTPNSKGPHRIRKAHTEFERPTPNSKSPHRIRKAHTEFEKPTPNSKGPHRIRKAHTEFEKPTPNSKTSHRIPKLTPNSKTSHRIRNSISKSLHKVSRQTYLQSTLTLFYPSNPSRVGREMRPSLVVSFCM